MPDERHQFAPYPGGRAPQSCLRCALPPAHPVHFHSESKPSFIERIDPNVMFLEIAAIVSKRSTCTRGSVGCVIVRDRRIVSTGYNGSPPGADHCLDVGCDIPYCTCGAGLPGDEHDLECPAQVGCRRTIHAEANAIVFAARHGVPLDGATMYSTYSPCGKCAQLIVAAGIKAFYWAKSYRLARLDILNDGGISTQEVPHG